MPKVYRFSIRRSGSFIGAAFTIEAQGYQDAVKKAKKAFRDYQDYGLSLDSLPGDMGARVFFCPEELTVDDIADVTEVT
jgi:hypothetical protein